LDSNRQGEQTSVKRKLRRLFSAAAAFFPISLLRRWLAWSVRDLCIALCFHRVSAQKRATDPQPELTVAPEVLDELLAFLTSSMPVAPAQLFLCFDDGYADAANYVAARAPFHSSVQWLFFVCPEKTEKRAGFRWDLFEATTGGQKCGANLDSFLDADLDIDAENRRPELRRIAESGDFRLATVTECAQLESLRNVSLGNHTNCHFRLTALSKEQAERELRASTSDFERLWGACRHFAFPFGGPIQDFTTDHVQIINQARPVLSWSTQQRPFRPAEIAPGVVLPRFTVYQFGNVKAMVMKICLLSTLFRRHFAGALEGAIAARRRS
jgi:hypothetical protein